jgi:hypothetical protein
MDNQRRFKESSPVRDRAMSTGARRARVMSKKPAGWLRAVALSQPPPAEIIAPMMPPAI